MFRPPARNYLNPITQKNKRKEDSLPLAIVVVKGQEEEQSEKVLITEIEIEEPPHSTLFGRRATGAIEAYIIPTCSLDHGRDEGG